MTYSCSLVKSIWTTLTCMRFLHDNMKHFIFVLFFHFNSLHRMWNVGQWHEAADRNSPHIPNWHIPHALQTYTKSRICFVWLRRAPLTRLLLFILIKMISYAFKIEKNSRQHWVLCTTFSTHILHHHFGELMFINCLYCMWPATEQHPIWAVPLGLPPSFSYTR